MSPLPIVPESSRDGPPAPSVTTPGAVDADVGAVLRVARQWRMLSLDDVEKATKIRVRVLEAIEANRRDQLPEPVFARGFVRAYAREVGLDPEDTVRRYFAQFAPVGVPAQNPLPVESAPASSKEPVDEAIARDERWHVNSQWLVIAAVLVVSVLASTVGQWWPSLPSSPPSTDTDRTSANATDSSRAATPAKPVERPETGTAGSREPTVAAAIDASAFHVDILAQGLCWVSATVDGERVFAQLMQPGDRHALVVRQGVVLRIGEPGAFAYSINGAGGRPLGRAGQPVTVRITPENYREFITQ